MPRKYIPNKHAQFWCDDCDMVVVDSEKPETGSFFVQFGHSYSQESKDYDGEHIGIMYALCPECQKV